MESKSFWLGYITAALMFCVIAVIAWALPNIGKSTTGSWSEPDAVSLVKNDVHGYAIFADTIPEDGTYQLSTSIEQDASYLHNMGYDSEVIIEYDGNEKYIYPHHWEAVNDSPDDKCYITLSEDEAYCDYGDIYYNNAVLHYPSGDVIHESHPLVSCDIDKGKATIIYEVAPGVTRKWECGQYECVIIDDGQSLAEKVETFDEEGFSKIEYRIHSLPSTD